LSRRVICRINDGFKGINRKANPEKPSPKMINNILNSSMSMLSSKMRATAEMTFRTLLEQFGLFSIADKMDATNKTKGKALMSLK
jgi:hypothetical protein